MIYFILLFRYIQICYTRSLYDKIFTFKKTVVWCFLCWVIGVLVDLPNFFHVLGKKILFLKFYSAELLYKNKIEITSIYLNLN